MQKLLETQSLLSILSAYGDVIELDYKFDDESIEEIKALNCEWFKASGNKEAINLTGPLNDLGLYAKDKHKFDQKYNDNILACPAIKDFIDKFNSLARCRVIKLNTGSYFRAHRDAWRFNEQFRIFIPLNKTDYSDWMFFLDNQFIQFKPGVPYILNTRKVHGSFSFSDDIYHVVMSLQLNQENLKTVMDMIPLYKEY